MDTSFKTIFTKYLTGEKETFASVLLSGLIKLYGVEVINWDALTIEMEIKEDFDVQMPRVIFDQLMGILTVLNTTEVYTKVTIFDQVINALTRAGLAHHDTIPSVEDVSWTVAEITMCDPQPATNKTRNGSYWGYDIQAYIRIVLDDEGFTVPPKILGFVESKNLVQEGSNDPSMFEAAFGSAQDKADEIDAWVEDRVEMLLQQLAELGIKPMDKEAEWTSDYNKDSHTTKHHSEFGSPEDYAAAEQVLSMDPPADNTLTDRRCKFVEGKPVGCTSSYYSRMLNTLHVKRDKDGKTVTLYKINKKPKPKIVETLLPLEPSPNPFLP